MRTKAICDGFTLEVVKTPTSKPVKWALKATMNGKDLYRLYYYKADAARNLEEWARYDRLGFDLEFNCRHNWQPLEYYT